MIRLPSARKPRELADWMEAELLFGGRPTISQTEIRALLSDDLGIREDWNNVTVDTEFPEMEAIGEDEDELTRNIERAFLLLETRSRRAGSSFPLEFVSGLWQARSPWEANIEYAFLVLLNLRVVLSLGTEVQHHEPAILFERLVATALANYLCGEAARFGVPHSDFDGNFESRSKALAKRMRERPRKELTTTSAQQGDYGLDVAAWRHFDDRESKIIVLCQCGIGDDFEGKCLTTRGWKRVIDFVCTPVTALAIPFEDYATEERTRNLAVEAGLLLDRSRIAKFACASDDTNNLVEDIRNWINEVIQSYYASEE